MHSGGSVLGITASSWSGLVIPNPYMNVIRTRDSQTNRAYLRTINKRNFLRDMGCHRCLADFLLTKYLLRLRDAWNWAIKKPHWKSLYGSGCLLGRESLLLHQNVLLKPRAWTHIPTTTWSTLSPYTRGQWFWHSSVPQPWRALRRIRISFTTSWHSSYKLSFLHLTWVIIRTSTGIQ